MVNTNPATFAIAANLSLAVGLRPFEDHDWHGFCDAARFEDGSAPLLGETRLVFNGQAHDAVVLLDANGLCVMVVDEESGQHLAFVDFPTAYAGRAVALLRHGMGWNAVVALPGCGPVCS